MQSRSSSSWETTSRQHYRLRLPPGGRPLLRRRRRGIDRLDCLYRRRRSRRLPRLLAFPSRSVVVSLVVIVVVWRVRRSGRERPGPNDRIDGRAADERRHDRLEAATSPAEGRVLRDWIPPARRRRRRRSRSRLLSRDDVVVRQRSSRAGGGDPPVPPPVLLPGDERMIDRRGRRSRRCVGKIIIILRGGGIGEVTPSLHFPTTHVTPR